MNLSFLGVIVLGLMRVSIKMASLEKIFTNPPMKDCWSRVLDLYGVDSTTWSTASFIKPFTSELFPSVETMWTCL